MSENHYEIIQKASELSELIKSHDISRQYDESLAKLSKDRAAQNLLEKLVLVGKKLNEKASKGENQTLGPSAESTLLNEQLEKNELVKSHILIQKQYLNMIHLTMEKIKNPVEE